MDKTNILALHVQRERERKWAANFFESSVTRIEAGVVKTVIQLIAKQICVACNKNALLGHFKPYFNEQLT